MAVRNAAIHRPDSGAHPDGSPVRPLGTAFPQPEKLTVRPRFATVDRWPHSKMSRTARSSAGSRDALHLLQRSRCSRAGSRPIAGGHPTGINRCGSQVAGQTRRVLTRSSPKTRPVSRNPAVAGGRATARLPRLRRAVRPSRGLSHSSIRSRRRLSPSSEGQRQAEPLVKKASGNSGTDSRS